MNPRRALSQSVIFLAVLTASIPLCAQTAPADTPTYRAGLKSIAVPAPDATLIETGPDYRVLLENLVPENNRLVAAFVTPDDLTSMKSGDSTSVALNRYALVEISRRAEFADIAPEMFKEISTSMAKQFDGDLTATFKEQEEAINRRLKALSSNPGPATIDKPTQLGALFSKPDACAFAMIAPYTSKGKTVRRAMGVILLRVQTRVLFVYLYTEFKDDSSVAWIRATTEQWADAILKANQH
jgi:hypothetical protein